jgi:hypothetical protein
MTLLLRQAHPKFMAGDLPTSQVFMPGSGDEGKLSCYDGDQISPPDAHIHYTQVLNLQSHSVWGLTCAEVDAQGVSSRSDPLPDFPSHAIVDFSDKSEKESRRIAKRLKTFAIARGCQYLPV